MSFNNQNRRRCIRVRITEDEVNELEESFQLRLGSLPGIDLLSNLVLDPIVASITILDNEGMMLNENQIINLFIIDHVMNLFIYRQ